MGGDRHGRVHRHAAVLRVGPRRAGPGSTSCRSAAPSARCSRSPAASPDGRPLQAILLGGAAGMFVGPESLDLPLTFEGARAAASTLGSGVVMVFDDTADLPGLLARIAGFFERRELRPVRAVPGRHRAAARAARAAARRGADARFGAANCCCWRSWARRCAMRRSAGWARRRRRPSSRPCSACTSTDGARLVSDDRQEDAIWFRLPPRRRTCRRSR